jgi:RimJ/RimL family protein N-acetyltransferase
MLRFGFERFGVRRISATVIAENTAPLRRRLPGDNILT